MRDIRFLLKTHYTNSRALLIGINQYKDASPLSYAVSDVEEVRDILINELWFHRDDITYLIDAEATRESILREFMRFTMLTLISTSEFSFSLPVMVIHELASVVK